MLPPVAPNGAHGRAGPTTDAGHQCRAVPWHDVQLQAVADRLGRGGRRLGRGGWRLGRGGWRLGRGGWRWPERWAGVAGRWAAAVTWWAVAGRWAAAVTWWAVAGTSSGAGRKVAGWASRRRRWLGGGGPRRLGSGGPRRLGGGRGVPRRPVDRRARRRWFGRGGRRRRGGGGRQLGLGRRCLQVARRRRRGRRLLGLGLGRRRRLVLQQPGEIAGVAGLDAEVGVEGAEAEARLLLVAIDRHDVALAGEPEHPAVGVDRRPALDGTDRLRLVALDSFRALRRGGDDVAMPHRQVGHVVGGPDRARLVAVEHGDRPALGRRPQVARGDGDRRQDVAAGRNRAGAAAVDLLDRLGSGGVDVAVDDQQAVVVGSTSCSSIVGSATGHLHRHPAVPRATEVPAGARRVEHRVRVGDGRRCVRHGAGSSGERRRQDPHAATQRHDEILRQDAAVAVHALLRHRLLRAAVDHGHALAGADQRGRGGRVDEVRAVGDGRAALRTPLDEAGDAVDEHQLRRRPSPRR